ncbi:MAG: sigma-70 family RNA polymerase sigma factor [Phycisphaeraceae bacterium]|nr:MAG: sigma-70 family RNA polymerase sigma factor [Phycisphaeraceae bacterium]
METKGHQAFETTRWSLIDALRSGDADRAREAGNRLITLYWPAVYGYLVRSGLDAERAGEVTQAFFADVVIARRLFEIADQETGRLRSLLLTALRRYRIDLARRGKTHPDWDRPDPSLMREVADRAGRADSPEAVFDREWAIAALDEARRQCEAHFCSNGRRAHWALFEARHITPVASGTSPTAFELLAPVYGFDSAAAAAAAVQVVRRRFRSILVSLMSDQNANNAEEEAGRLLGVLTSCV